MIVVRISGGLGNQMFQYAYARALQSQGNRVCLHWHPHHSKSEHNGFELDRVFSKALSDTIPLANKSILLRASAWRQRKTARRREVHELQFQPEFLKMKSGYLDGYWQTEKYFESISDKIREDFEFKTLKGAQNLELLEQLSQSESCSIHIRRGDYVGHPELGGVCNEAYYRRALEKIDARHPNCPLFVFSDDIDFSKELLKKRMQVQFCDWNRGNDCWMDLLLMCRCTHHIIANSSFSWWGAWLSKSNGTVIGPSLWNQRKDSSGILPLRWITV